MSGGQEALVQVRRKIQEAIDNRIKTFDKIVGGSEMKTLKDLNRTYKNASTINSISKKATAGLEGNMAFGLPELIVGGAAGAGSAAYEAAQGRPEGAIESAAKGLLAGAALKTGRTFGTALGQAALSRGGQMLQGAGQNLQQRAPGLLEIMRSR